MQITRRNFVRTIGIGACTIYLTGAGGSVLGQSRSRHDYFPIPAEAYTDPLYSVTAKQFARFVNRDFLLVSEDGESFEVVLTEVNPNESLGNTSTGVYGESFSLIFEGRSDRVKLSQGVYAVSAEGIESFSALIVPTGRLSRQNEIVINHLSR